MKPIDLHEMKFSQGQNNNRNFKIEISKRLIHMKNLTINLLTV